MNFFKVYSLILFFFIQNVFGSNSTEYQNRNTAPTDFWRKTGLLIQIQQIIIDYLNQWELVRVLQNEDQLKRAHGADSLSFVYAPKPLHAITDEDVEQAVSIIQTRLKNNMLVLKDMPRIKYSSESNCYWFSLFMGEPKSIAKNTHILVIQDVKKNISMFDTQHYIDHIVFSPDNNYFVSVANTQNEIKIWDFKTKDCLATIPTWRNNKKYNQYQVLFIESYLVFAMGGYVAVLDLSASKWNMQSIPSEIKSVKSIYIAESNDKRYVAISGDQRVEIWENESLALLNKCVSYSFAMCNRRRIELEKQFPYIAQLPLNTKDKQFFARWCSANQIAEKSLAIEQLRQAIAQAKNKRNIFLNELEKFAIKIALNEPALSELIDKCIKHNA